MPERKYILSPASEKRRELEAEVARLRAALELNHAALESIYLEELNGRVRRRHWAQAGVALAAGREALRSPAGETAEGVGGASPGAQTDAGGAVPGATT